MTIRVRLIQNGKSAGSEALRSAVNRLRDEGHSVDVRVTWESGDAARYASEVAQDPAVVVMAGGGDGTVNEVLNGLMSADDLQVSMGIVPFGTANDFATSLGIPIGDPYQALKLAFCSKPVRVDVGKANDRYFLNVASGGFGTDVTVKTPLQLKKEIGAAAYSLTALVMAMKAHPYRGRLITQERTYEGSMLMMAVGNGRQSGGGVKMTPHATINDGLLDVMVVPDHEHERFIHLISELVELKRDGAEHFHYLRVGQCRIESEDELQFNLDGEPLRGFEFNFTVLPLALSMVLPFDSPLLAS